METAVMRERINDVAAEVARLTAVLEGPNSPIDTILAGDAARPRTPANGAVTAENGSGDKHLAAMAANGAPKGSLADRIRALQSRRSQLTQAS
jgi:hypothetical protein